MSDWVMVPRDCTDEIAEAICGQVNVCGGIAESIWRAAVTASQASQPAEADGEAAWEELVNKDDLTSPEEYPDMCTPPAPNDDLRAAAAREQMAAVSPTVRRIVGPTILIANGTYFDFLDPESASFGIEDVAHGLSHICRFAGQCREFYSVAEHSVYVSLLVPPEHAFAALLHDAAEAFIGDVAKPLKDLLPEYKAIEDRVEKAVLGRFGLSKPLHPSVKEADIVMLATEQRALMRNDDDWQYTHGRQPANIEIKALPPAEARALFLSRFGELAALKENRRG